MNSLTTFTKTSSSILALIICFGFFTFQCSKDHDPGVKGPLKSCSTCTFVIAGTNDLSIIDGAKMGVKPGDTICLDAKVKFGSSVEFRNIEGSAAKPVIITNCGGTVNIVITDKRPFNIKTSGCKNFRITGGDTDKYYGFVLTGSYSLGMILTDLSTDFEVDHIEISKTGFAGLMAKTDPKCSDPSTFRENFTMRNVLLHDNYIHDTGGEGFYLGHSSYGGVTDVCGVIYPHLIENISVYNNHVVRSGWDGMQLECASVGAAIYGNVIENYAVKNEPAQQNGILMGGGTNGVCYGNIVNTGTGIGICTFGLADNIFYDNIVINAGDKGFFADKRGTPPGDGFKFINNTVINPHGQGIAIYNSGSFPHNAIINNIIVKSNATDNKTFIVTLGDSTANDSHTKKANNFTTTSIKDLKFVNEKNNFRVKSGSPVIDQGADISSYGINFDFYNANRKNGSAYDIGAAEF